MPDATFQRREITATLTQADDATLTFDIEENHDGVVVTRRKLKIPPEAMTDYLETRQDTGLTEEQFLEKWSLHRTQLNDLEAAQSVCADPTYFDVLAQDLPERIGWEGIFISARTGPQPN